MSGLSGYIILAAAANRLTPAQFAELTLMQTAMFLLQTAFDSGMVQYATRETSGSPDWRSSADRFQGIRLTTHAVVAGLFLLVVWLGIRPRTDASLPIAAALALFSNAFVADWLVISRQEHLTWSLKVLLCATVNVVVASTLLIFCAQPSVILVAVVSTNISGWIYLRRKAMLRGLVFRMPRRQDLSVAMQLSVAAMLFHAAYNAPLVVATGSQRDASGAAFAVLYRIFSALTLFVPLLLEFATAREIARLKTGQAIPQVRVFGRLLSIGLTLCVPVVLIPNGYLHLAILQAIDLDKYGILVPQIGFLKVALLLFCIDYASQRAIYVSDHRRLMIASAAAGLAAAAVILVLTARGNLGSGPEAWFYPLFGYQAVAATLVMCQFVRRDRRPHRES